MVGCKGGRREGGKESMKALRADGCLHGCCVSHCSGVTGATTATASMRHVTMHVCVDAQGPSRRVQCIHDVFCVCCVVCACVCVSSLPPSLPPSLSVFMCICAVSASGLWTPGVCTSPPCTGSKWPFESCVLCCVSRVCHYHDQYIASHYHITTTSTSHILTGIPRWLTVLGAW